MRHHRARFRRTLVSFVVGLVVVFPVSAVAAPGGIDAAVHGDGNGHSDDSPGRSDEAPDKAEDRPGRSDEAPGKAEDRPGRSDEAPGRIGLAPGHDETPGRPAITPSGVVPGTPGPAQADRDRGVGAAFVLLELADDEEIVVLVTPAEPQGLSGDIASVLSPVMPPGLVDAVTSPVVIFEALLEAMISSGQALVIPFLAAGIGFLMPGLRRRDLVSAIVDGD